MIYTINKTFSFLPTSFYSFQAQWEARQSLLTKFFSHLHLFNAKQIFLPKLGGICFKAVTDVAIPANTSIRKKHMNTDKCQELPSAVATTGEDVDGKVQHRTPKETHTLYIWHI